MVTLKDLCQPCIQTLLLFATVATATVSSPVNGASFDNVASFDCAIYPSREADIGSASVGVLESLLVERSDFVEEGVAIAQLESSAQEAAVALATARAEAAAEVNFRQLSAEHSKRQLSRIEQLVEKDSASMKEFDDRETEAKLGEQQLRKAIENKKILALELASAEVALEKRTVVSPFNGVVVETYKTAGEYVNADPILRIAQLDPLYIETIIPAEQLGRIQPGMRADVVTVGSADQRWVAHVDRVDSVIDVASGTFGVRLKLPNPDLSIAAGLRCEVSFIDATRTMQGPVLGAAMPLAGAETQSDEPLTCISAGPYDDLSIAQRQAKQALSRGDVVEIVEKPVKETQGYFLMSQEFTSRDEADSYLSRLESVGITDSFLLSQTSPMRVSVGAFPEHKNATARMEQLSSEGIQSEIVLWEKSNEQYFLVGQGAQGSFNAGCPLPASSQ